MTTYYVGIGGDNANAGTSWALRKLTLNGAEDIPVAAGDTVYVGPGTYRELLTVDVAGSAGNPITYIGDYLGTNTDGVGGLVRITGSDNDQTATRAQCVNMPNARGYRTFRGFMFDMCTGSHINLQASSDALIVEDCHFQPGSGTTAMLALAGIGTGYIIRRCSFFSRGAAVNFTHSTTVDNAGHLMENCVILAGASASSIAVRDDRIGGITVKNCAVLNAEDGIRVQTALTAAQTLTVNNCILFNCNVGVRATIAGELVENYNTFWANGTDRANVNTGANSVAYPPLFEPRWFFQILYGGAGPSDASQVISPFDLASFSQLIDFAGTSPPTTDLRGTAVQGAQREYGPLEYDSTLKIESAAAGGGMVRHPGMSGGLDG